jgi:hypothetical protein
VKKAIVLISLFFLILAAFLFIDWILIPQLFLHNDACYYHNHDAPFLIDLFFVDSSGHVDPPFSLINLSTVVSLSVIATILVSRSGFRKMIDKGQKKDPVKQGL